ncbi:MAG: solute:sodium symporter family transporter [Eubacteriales bacterium]|nr:solute:sodium symporter family transporter [Eubacteriales bacterium]
MGIILGSFLGVTLIILLISFYQSRKVAKNTSDGYFLGGRSLTGGVIGASLLLTNLSATNFVGMTSDVYRVNMSTIGWETPCAIALVIVAVVLLPRYLSRGFATIPDFLEERYDKSVKTWVSVLFLICYLCNTLPICLYAGAITVNQIFDIPGMFGLTYAQGVWAMVLLIGVIGIIYALVGGLKMVATADTLNGVLLVIGGLLVPIFGLLALGKGSIGDAMTTILNAAPEKLNAIGTEQDLLPFSTLFTGLMPVLIYYWGMDQAIIQRALAAKNLKEGQKGVMFAGFLKLLTPIVLMFPGIICFHLFGAGGIENSDLAYATLVNRVLPKPLIGLFIAAMFGAILSTFNGTLNSVSTLFAMNIYKGKTKDGEPVPEEKIVRVGKICGLIVGVCAMFVAPMFMYAPDGLYSMFQQLNGLFNVPIFTIMVMGYLNKKTPAIAAKISLVVFIAVFGVTTFFMDLPIYYLHVSGIMFVLCCIFMWIMGKVKPTDKVFERKRKNVVDIQPWKYRYEFGTLIACGAVLTYIALSPIGFASPDGADFMTGVWMVVGVAATCVVGFIFKKIMKRFDREVYEEKVTEETSVA